MEQMDKIRFAKCMAILAESFTQEYSSKKIDIYYQALKDLPIENIERAVWNLVNTRTTATFPKVAEIRESINGKTEDRAILALAKVERALREVGAYNSIVFDDPIIHKVICSFDNGWIGIADMTTEEWIWGRKDFIRLYEAYSNNGVHEVPHRLLGRIETDNENKGYDGKFQIIYFNGMQKALDWQSKVSNQVKYLRG